MFCSNCGKEISENSSFCSNCGYRLGDGTVSNRQSDILLNTLAQRLNINAIIWIVIGILQVLGGIFIDWFLLIIGVLNIISSVQDMNYSKAIFLNPTGIVAKVEPLTGPIITLIYNLVIGGVIGVIGSIYYFLCIRNYVMENRSYFESLNNN